MKILLSVDGGEPVEIADVEGKVRTLQVASPYGALGRMDCDDLSAVQIYVDLHAGSTVFLNDVVPLAQPEETVVPRDPDEDESDDSTGSESNAGTESGGLTLDLDGKDV